MGHEEIVLDGHRLMPDDVASVARRGTAVRLDPQAVPSIERSCRWVDEMVRSGRVVYGINTGLGSLQRVLVVQDEVKRLQRNVILSHATGVGDAMATECVRAAMLIRANAFARGVSGVRVELIALLVNMLNRGVHPVIPEKGSLGASGDLQPLSAVGLVMLGLGEAEYEGQVIPGGEALRRADLEPIELQAKEGLALNNGTAASSAIACLALIDAENLLRNSDIALAMSLEALQGFSRAYREEMHAERPHEGQMETVRNVNRLVKGSQLLSAAGAHHDAYSLRCAPQVLGAIRDTVAFVRQTLSVEINSATDDPLILMDMADPGDQDNYAVLGGNFHAEPVALASDFLGIAITEAASISERRTFRLLDENLNRGLPSQLVDDGGLNTGFMIAHYTAAALVSDCKTLAHPDSVDSIPTSENHEDHVSMATNAARHAREILRNAEQVVAVELLCAAQALEYRIQGRRVRTVENEMDESGSVVRRTIRVHRDLQHAPPAEPGRGTMAAFRHLREASVSRLDEDRWLAPDMTRVASMVHDGAVIGAVERELRTG